MGRLDQGHGVVLVGGNPFDLDDDLAYRQWRDRKLANYPQSVDALRVEISDPTALTRSERAAILDRVRCANMVLYATAKTGQDSGGQQRVAALGTQFGLNRLDAHLQANESCITALEVAKEGEKSRYIPYTDKAIKWHTDGYYNLPDARIRALILHCERPAKSGGENALVDHEIAYIMLRDEDPALVAALYAPDTFVVPPNIDQGREIRGARPNPVFYVDPRDGALGMNYSMRARNMNWREDGATRAAVAFLAEFLASDSPYILRHTMASGEGLICNNVLHDRSAFADEAEPENEGRLMYRARYLDRISETGL